MTVHSKGKLENKVINIQRCSFDIFHQDFPLVYLTSDRAPRTLAYYVFLNSTEGDAAAQMAHIRMAAGVFMTIVPALVFGIFQKQLTDGVLTTGKKG